MKKFGKLLIAVAAIGALAAYLGSEYGKSKQAQEDWENYYCDDEPDEDSEEEAEPEEELPEQESLWNDTEDEGVSKSDFADEETDPDFAPDEDEREDPLAALAEALKAEASGVVAPSCVKVFISAEPAKGGDWINYDGTIFVDKEYVPYTASFSKAVAAWKTYLNSQDLSGQFMFYLVDPTYFEVADEYNRIEYSVAARNVVVEDSWEG